MHSGSVPKQEVICAILNKKEYKNTGFQNQIKSEAEIRYFITVYKIYCLSDSSGGKSGFFM